MKDYNKYVREWQDLSIQLNEAMQKDNFDEADRLIVACNEAYNNYKRCSQYPSENNTMSFGELNFMLESELPRLFKEDKKALKECTNFIKSDPNLLSQFKFIDSLRNYGCEGDSVAYVRESIELASKGIDKKTLSESVHNFANLLAKHEIGGHEINEEDKKYFKSCEAVLCESKKLTNLTKYTNNVNSIAEYIEKNKKNINENKTNANDLFESFVSKMETLDEEDRRLVNDIIDFKNESAIYKQENLFNKFKNECISIIDKLVSESKDSEDLEGVEVIKEQLKNKVFCQESLVQDIAQLLEIRDVLREK